MSVERRVGIALWCLATNGDYRSISYMSGVAKGTVCIIVNEVCQTIVKVLLKMYVKLPSHKQMEEIVNGFQTKCDSPSALEQLTGHTCIY